MRLVDLSNKRIFLAPCILAIALALPIVGFLMDAFLCPEPHLDAEMFRYFGWRMVCGDRLYLDVWDCKGPMLLFFNALGAKLWAGSCVGCDFVAMMCWVLTIVLLYRCIADSLVSRFAAAIAACLFSFWGCGIWGLRFQNCQEIIAALFAMLAISVGLHNDTRNRPFLIGACAAGAFMTKGNLASFGVAFFALWLYDFCLYRDFAKFVRNITYSFFGCVLTITSVLLYFWRFGGVKAGA